HEADKVVYKEGGDSVERAITTDASLVAAQDNDNILKTQTIAMPNVDIPQGMDIGGSPRHQETIGVVLLLRLGRLSDDDLDEEDASKQGEESDKTKRDSSTAITGFSTVSAPVTTAGVAISTVEPRTPPTTAATAFIDEDLTIAQTLIKMKEGKPKEKGVAIKDVEDSPRPIRSITILQPLPIIDPKDKGKGILVKEELKKPEKVKRRDQGIDADHELAVRLTHEEQEKYTIEERARLLAEFFERRKKQLAAERAEAIRNKPATRTQVRNRMITYLKHMDDDSRQQAESTKKRPRADSEEESSKKQKLEDDNNAEKEELRDSMDVVPRDDVTIDVESLATKYPIVDWKIHILKENIMYYQIIRADGSSKNYKIFSEMLDDFDRLDVIDLHRLVNERYETTSPEGYDLLLWGDLKTLFEPNEEDEIWKNQQDYNLIRWRLFDLCRVHVLLMNTGVAIHMMIEKKYPLTQEMLSRMLNRRLKVDYESEMAFELFEFSRSQLQK
ncbi:hypothetical protein Tco_1356595, partial [Tanacetum coccineum]